MTLPTDDALRRFLAGTLPADEAERVAEWLDADPAAAARLDALDTANDMTDALRADTARMSPAPAAPDLLPSGYRFVRELGRGGMGIVVEAEDVRLGRRVAIKRMLPDTAKRPDAKARFLREARAMAAVESDHIVPILHVGETPDGTPYLVMPRLAGETLADRLTRGRLSADELRRVAADTAAGLADAHAKGLIHRDIKPSNLWLEANPNGTFRRVRLLDFGLAKPTAPDETTVTHSNAVVGTPQYMSPEQARAEKLGPPTDLFSLGAVLYRAATGKQPFPGDTASAVLTALAVDEPKPVRELAPSVPAEIADLIHALLEKNVAGRPTTDDVIRRLAPAAVAPPTSPPRRNRWAVAGGAAAALLAVVAGVIIIRYGKTEVELDGVQAKVTKEGDKIVVTVKEPTPPAPGKEKPTKGNPPELAPRPRVDEREWQTKRPDRDAQEKKSFEWLVGIQAYIIGLRDASGRELRGTDIADWKPGTVVTVLEARNNPAITDATFDEYIAPLADLEILDIERPPEWTAKGFASVGRLKKLKSLCCSMPLDDKACEVVAKLPAVESVAGSGAGLTRSGAEALAGCKTLRNLVLGDAPRLTDDILGVILRKPGLTRLTLAHCPKVTAAAWAGVGERPALTDLWLFDVALTDDGLKTIAACYPSLESLKLGNLPITGAGFAHLVGLKRLRYVEVEGCPASDENGLAALTRLPQLTKLSLRHTKVSDAGFEALAKCESLSHVDVSSTAVGDRSVVVLAGMPTLRDLRMAGTKVTDAALPHLSKLSTLTVLNVTDTGITADGLAQLRKALPKCQVWPMVDPPALAPPVLAPTRAETMKWIFSLEPQSVVLRDADGGYIPIAKPEDDRPGMAVASFCVGRAGNRTTAADLKTHLPNLSGLEHFESGGSHLPDEAVELLSSLPKLKTVVLSADRITDKGLKTFGGMKRLTKLLLADLREPNVTAAGLAELARSPALTELRLQKCELTEDAYARIGDLARLEVLEVRDSPAGFLFTGAAMTKWKKLTALRELHLDGTQTTDAALAALADFTALEMLTLDTGTRVTGHGLDKLATLPRLRVLILINTRFDDDGCTAVAKLPALVELSVQSTLITAKGVAELAKTKSLTGLNLDHNKQLMGADIAGSLANMNRLTKLRVLDIPFADDELKKISEFPHLVSVGFSTGAITNAGVKHFVGKPQFTELSFLVPGVTDAAVPDLCGMTQLTWLDVTGSRITADGLAKLRKALPKCQVLPVADPPGPVPKK